MKTQLDKKLIKYGIYVTVTAIAIYAAFQIIANVSDILKCFFKIIGFIYSLMKPLIFGGIIAYLLYPITQFIEKTFLNNKIYSIKKKSTGRTLSILCSYLFIMGLFAALLCGIYFMIGGQLSKNTTIVSIFNDLVSYFNNTNFDISSTKETIEKLDVPFIKTLKPYILDFITYVQNYIITNIGDMTNYIMSIGSGIATGLISIVISIYLLKDSEYFIGLWKKLYYIIFRNSKAGKSVTEIFKVIHEVFSKFIRGQLLEAIFVGILSAIFLYIVGIDYAFVIGTISGFCNMIPYVGPIAGTILAAIIGLLSGNPMKVIYAIIAMIIVQQIDNNLLAPKIVGDSVGLHAVFTMMAILVGGSVGGLFGMLLAVPLAASFRILFNRWYDSFKEKETEKNNVK